MLPSSQQRYPKCTELWFLPRLSLERPCGQILLLIEHIFRVSACGRRGGDDFNKCCWKKNWSESWSNTISSNLLSSHSSSNCPCMYMLPPPPPHTQTHKLLCHCHLSYHHKEQWQAFVSWDSFYPFMVVLAGHMTENSHANWEDYFIHYYLLMSCMSYMGKLLGILLYFLFYFC